MVADWSRATLALHIPFPDQLSSTGATNEKEGRKRGRKMQRQQNQAIEGNHIYSNVHYGISSFRQPNDHITYSDD